MSNFRHCLSTFSSSHPPASSSSSYSNQHLLSVEDEKWLMVERTANEILSAIRPNFHSEKTRVIVIKFIQTIFWQHLGTKVFPFGSVPLKTYLPHGDIDLTAITYRNIEDAVANNIHDILKAYELNNSGFLVTDVNMIKAQVKIVKCLVEHIPVDISFNKVGGFSTLCFLEKVDKHIGRGHLFKRSIILIKAWCYYESRILGASNGLISTYALETLILHIINLFHSCLHGPLAVLYKFLEYYSSFQWEKYGISLNGLIALEALPEVVVERPVTEADMLLSEDFIQSCKKYFSHPIRAVETEGERFQLTPINIVDPLNGENNLGRCICRGNFYRIRYAFSYGYRKLRDLLMLQEGSISGGLMKFFANTLNWKQRLEMENQVSRSRDRRRYEVSDLNGNCMSSFQGLIYGQWCLNYTLPFPIRDDGNYIHIEQDAASLENKDDGNCIHIEQDAASLEKNDDGDCIHLNFSLEHFPRLPTREAIPSGNHQASYKLEDDNDFPSLCH
ncbi:hypothetical protein Pfo_015119 [Paulownia fortunei]|nr:hypothetical protein Pfo_015119 [Paulownia fortunei]